jgi:ribosomal protein S18 acetylase RimI-like enzyme
MPLIRQARPEDCNAIATHIRNLARDIGSPVKPKVTPTNLRTLGFGSNPLLLLWVAELDGRVIGYCVGNFIYSTWRGAPGLYVVDLYVDPEARGARIGERLLRAAVREAWQKGARFVRLDVGNGNHGAARFYERVGFHQHQTDRFFVLDEPEFRQFAGQA